MRYLLALLFLCPSSFAITASGDVPIKSPVYDRVDELEAMGCGYRTYRLFRPQTYADLRSTIDVGEDREAGALCTLPRSLRKEKQVLLLRPGQMPSVQLTLMTLGDELVPLQGLEASVSPSFPLWDRRPEGAGLMSYLDFTLSTQSGGDGFGFAAGVTPTLGVTSLASLGTQARFYLYEGYAKASYKWAELEIARKSLQFGNAAHGNLLLSGAESPMTFARFGIRPHLVGSPLNFGGPLTFQTFVTADTGSKLTPGAHLWGIHLGARPASWLELGLLELYQFGGPAAQALDVGDVMKMFVYGSSQTMNLRRQKQLASHFGFHLLPAVQLYFQLAFDSLGPINRWFADDISWLTGLWLADLGKLGIRVEYVQTPPGAYQAPAWKSGLVYDATPIGHPLGPDAEGLYVDFHFPDIKEFRPTLSGFYERRWRHAPATSGTESRLGAGLSVEKRWVKMELGLVGKIAHVENPKYKLGGATNVAAAQLQLRYHFL